jgi:hypothetical protein
MNYSFVFNVFTISITPKTTPSVLRNIYFVFHTSSYKYKKYETKTSKYSPKISTIFRPQNPSTESKTDAF